MTRIFLTLILALGIINASDENARVVDQLLKEEKYYNILLRKLKDTQKNIEGNKEKLTRSKENLDELETTAKILNNTKLSLEREIVKLISKKYAITTAVKKEYKTTEKNTINRELYKVLLQNAKQQINRLDSDYDTIAGLIRKNKEKTLDLYTLIDDLEQKKELFAKQKKEQEKTLSALKKKRDMLAKLEEEKRKEQKKVENIKGEKIISPLKEYTITKKFGKYFDETQNIEMFNESLYLESKTKNAKVYNVLEGRIVYVKRNSNILGNVVIIKNKDNIFTIYSHLSRIFRSVKSGESIKAGIPLGRVERVLKFKVTKNTTYIDPMLILNL